MHRLDALLLVTVAIGGILPGQMVLTLTDGTTTRGSLSGIASDGSWAWLGTSGPMKVPSARVVGLDSGDAVAPPLEESFRIDLASGDSLVGRIEDGSADDVRLRSAAFGDVTISLDDVVGIWNLAVPRSPESLPPTQGDEETLYLDRDGRVDHFPGRLEKIGKNQLTFMVRRGDIRAFSFEQAPRVIAVRWATAESVR